MPLLGTSCKEIASTLASFKLLGCALSHLKAVSESVDECSLILTRDVTGSALREDPEERDPNNLDRSIPANNGHMAGIHAPTMPIEISMRVQKIVPAV